MRKSKCKKCKKPMIFCQMASGKLMPLDAEPKKMVQVKEGIGEIIDVYMPHWATCPGA